MYFEEVMETNWENLNNNIMEAHKREQVIKLAKEIFLAMCFMVRENDRQFGFFKRILGMNNNISMDTYPTNMQSVHKLLSNMAGILDSKNMNI